MKRLLTAMLVAMILSTSLVACSTEPKTKRETPTEPATQPQAQTENVDGLPSSMDLRNYNGKNYVTPVKQQFFGDCWTFATTATAEIAYLYANDMGVPVGEVNDAVNFSEKYISWYSYHNITDDDVITGKVRESQLGEGYEVTQAESKYINAVYNLGGCFAGINLFASGFLPIDEKVSINNEYPYAYRGKNVEVTAENMQAVINDDWSLPLNAQYRNPEFTAFFRNCCFLPSPATRVENGEYKFNEAGVTAIKKKIAKGHAVLCGYYFTDNMNLRNWATYSHSKTSNHVVTIIGYDDNYSKDNFARKNMDGDIIKKSVPPADGAFIAKNSWGKWGIEGSGCFYISYYDESIKCPASLEFDKTDSVICKNPNYDQYDMFMSATYTNIDYEAETKIANVYDAQEDQALYQIEYVAPKPDVSVHYAIYKDTENDNPESGTLLEEGDNTHEWGGYYKIDLKDKCDLKKGDKYSIVLTMKYTAEDGKSHYADVIPYGVTFNEDVVATGVINNGESCLFTDGSWADMTESTDIYSQKAYEHNINDNIAEEFKANSVDDIIIDNYPIKGISIPKN